LISNHFRDSVGDPEKAGVGGSIPSLATNICKINLSIPEDSLWSRAELPFLRDSSWKDTETPGLIHAQPFRNMGEFPFFRRLSLPRILLKALNPPDIAEAVWHLS